MKYSMHPVGTIVLILTLSVGRLVFGRDEFEQPPIQYSRSIPDNRMTDLQAALDHRETRLRFDSNFGYLPDLLKKLDIPTESQMLVFSKTSLQNHRISPRAPRALYFNDDVYVGYCLGGDLLEISAADPQLGTVFYTLDQSPAAVPQITRQTDKCLQCHGTALAGNIPGHIVRSLFVDSSGQPLLAEGTRRVDQTTPIEQRWGGWYVTGSHGTQQHLGNFVVRDREAARPWTNEDGQNVRDLSSRISTARYLTAHSDVVSLMVFEHQTYVHNLLTQAGFTSRQALHYEVEMNKALGYPEDRPLESTTRRIESAGEKLVRGLLFADEAPITGPFTGTSGFAEQFSQTGLRDRQGRSLRDFDLKSRLFKYPCSYLIYSREFDALPPTMKAFVARRLREVLDGHGGQAYGHLSAADRNAILEILVETKPGLWKE